MKFTTKIKEYREIVGMEQSELAENVIAFQSLVFNSISSPGLKPV